MNRLTAETSPYLLQHADNPVDWYPWGEPALTRARSENKPLLLSIGYAACHWCHVMAHESFENPHIAALMNDLFINIKIDREERPDLDAIYQAALALLGEHGGWPLTMFCTPGAEPFWGGTYFPPEPRYGRAGFPQVLQQVATVYREHPEKVRQNQSALMEALTRMSTPTSASPIPEAVLDETAASVANTVDPVHGGLAGAPKFPQPSVFKLLWRAHKRRQDDHARRLVELTLDRMAQGGIYDHLGGGFARYSVDATWLVPHFEKMLYDNAQLVELYTQVWQATRRPLYAQRVNETIDWLLRDMTAENGAFFATIDADSEGEEGKYYVWTAAEIDACLGPAAVAFKQAYDVRPAGNWEGRTILNRTHAPQLGPADYERALAAARTKLLERRRTRIAPGLDDKILADWNGLMIAALAEASAVFDRSDWCSAAERAFRFVLSEMQRDGNLLHSWRDAQPKHPATLDDYANMARAALILFEVTGTPDYLRQAQTWLRRLDEHYWDHEGAGYFFTADHTKDVITRTKTALDHATPAGNGTLIEVLARLYYLTGENDFRIRAESLAQAFSEDVQRNPLGFATLLNSLDLLHNPTQIVLLGDADGDDTQASLRAIYGASLPNRILTVAPTTASLPATHPAAGKTRQDDTATAYVCHRQTCSLPITDPITLAAELARI